VNAVDVTTEVTIAAPVPRVAAFAADPSNVPQWYANIRSIEWQTEPIVAVGSRVAFVARFLGRTLRYVYEIVEFTADVRLVMRTADGPFPMETAYTWNADGDGTTRMTLRNRGAPSGFSRLVSPFMGAAMRRANRKDLAQLKSILERR
jgi:uncharacterized membrane protein